MDIDYQHLLAGTVPAFRYGPANASRVDGLLARAKACVLGRHRGQFFIDIHVDGVAHRVAFDRDADSRLLLSRIEARGIPVHRDREVILGVLGIGAVLVLAIALAVWLGP